MRPGAMMMLVEVMLWAGGGGWCGGTAWGGGRLWTGSTQ